MTQPALPVSSVPDARWDELRAAARQEFPERLSKLAAGEPREVPEELAGVINPDVLLFYQQEAVGVIDHWNVVIIEKSRRIGLTWGIGAKAVLTAAASRQAGGMDVMYVGYNKEMAREFIDVCAMWGRAFRQAASEVREFVFNDGGEGDKDIQAYRIIFASGFEIVALASRPRSLRGRQGLVIIDEAAFHDDLDALIKAALALLMWGGRVVIISTHDGEDNPFNLLCEEVRKGRKPYKLLTITFDQALADGLYQRICLVTGKPWTPEAETAWREEILATYGEHADEELHVIPSQGSGQYIPAGLVQQRMVNGIPVVRFEQADAFTWLPEHLRVAVVAEFCEREIAPLLSRLDPNLESYFGEDFARVGDLTVLWPAQVGRDMRLVPAFVVELWNIPYEQQRQVVFYILRRLPRFRRACFDATGNGGFLAEVSAQEFGSSRVEQIQITAQFYAEVMPKFKAAFEDGRVALPSDLDIYNDHRAIKKVRGIPCITRDAGRQAKGEDGKTAKKKRHGDAAVAHLMAWWATQGEFVEYDYEPAAPVPASGDIDTDDDSGRWPQQGAW